MHKNILLANDHEVYIFIKLKKKKNSIFMIKKATHIKHEITKLSRYSNSHIFIKSSKQSLQAEWRSEMRWVLLKLFPLDVSLQRSLLHSTRPCPKRAESTDSKSFVNNNSYYKNMESWTLSLDHRIKCDCRMWWKLLNSSIWKSKIWMKKWEMFDLYSSQFRRDFIVRDRRLGKWKRKTVICSS